MPQPSYRIVNVNAENIDDIGIYCSRSKQKEEGYQRKLAWIKDRFKEGLEYRVLLVYEGKKDLAYRGMIEFMPRWEMGDIKRDLAKITSNVET